ncbi:hypothetical protein INS49_002178 [Diaporthe citri]|uniref:uncharacterized protein n=1 Tax=Diaporthe citri TaxID=83186 RepID=UPI001C8192D4|nr:uncharacterized protein INS49_002178 [Diaporthe citri]KAG6367978.1 hypothetical protein INS49_002178 [Diaporthe citri]
MTVRGSTHMSQSDFAVLFPKWMDLFIKTLIHPQRGIYLTVAPTLEFLKIVLPQAQTLSYDTSNWVDEGLLRKSQPDFEISVEHTGRTRGGRPARLKIDNEFQTWGPGDEVWMHMCPRKEDVDKRLEHRDGREIERTGGEHEQWPRPTAR